MTQTVPATCVLGPGLTGLTIGLRVLNLDGTEYAAFATTGVAETSVLGTYRKAGGVVCPDAGGYIVWGVSGTDYAEATVDAAPTAAPSASDNATATAAAILVTPANKLATGSVGEADANVIFWNGSSVAPTDANGNVPALLCETQPSVTFGQIKIRASVDGQGAIDVLNTGLTGIGIYAEGQTGQKNVGTNTGVYNYGGSYGQVNEGPGEAGAYNTGASPVGGVDSWGIRNAIGMADPNMDIQLAAVAKTGADGDTLKTLSDQIDGVGGVSQQDIADALLMAPVGVAADGSAMDYLADILEDTGTTLPGLISAGGGTGLYSETITVNDLDGSPVDGVLVQVATESGFANIVRSGTTNNLGQVTLHFDAAGTYYGRAEIAGYGLATFTVEVTA